MLLACQPIEVITNSLNATFFNYYIPNFYLMIVHLIFYTVYEIILYNDSYDAKFDDMLRILKTNLKIYYEKIYNENIDKTPFNTVYEVDKELIYRDNYDSTIFINFTNLILISVEKFNNISYYERSKEMFIITSIKNIYPTVSDFETQLIYMSFLIIKEFKTDLYFALGRDIENTEANKYYNKSSSYYVESGLYNTIKDNLLSEIDDIDYTENYILYGDKFTKFMLVSDKSSLFLQLTSPPTSPSSKTKKIKKVIKYVKKVKVEPQPVAVEAATPKPVAVEAATLNEQIADKIGEQQGITEPVFEDPGDAGKDEATLRDEIVKSGEYAEKSRKILQIYRDKIKLPQESKQAYKGVKESFMPFINALHDLKFFNQIDKNDKGLTIQTYDLLTLARFIGIARKPDMTNLKPKNELTLRNVSYPLLYLFTTLFIETLKSDDFKRFNREVPDPSFIPKLPAI